MKHDVHIRPRYNGTPLKALRAVQLLNCDCELFDMISL